MKRVARKRPSRRKAEIDDYIVLIERTALSLGINHHYEKWTPPRPYSRTLHLHGQMALPKRLAGLKVETVLRGDSALDETPATIASKNVAYLMRHGDEVQITASVPPDFIPTLSSAFHDGRLHVISGRGPKLDRGGSLLIDLHFEERVHFEDYWGEQLSLS